MISKQTTISIGLAIPLCGAIFWAGTYTNEINHLKDDNGIQTAVIKGLINCAEETHEWLEVQRHDATHDVHTD